MSKRFSNGIRKRPRPGSCYARPKVLTPLVRCWRTAHHPCSKRLNALLPLWLEASQRTFGRLAHAVVPALQRISPGRVIDFCGR